MQAIGRQKKEKKEVSERLGLYEKTKEEGRRNSDSRENANACIHQVVVIVL